MVCFESMQLINGVEQAVLMVRVTVAVIHPIHLYDPPSNW